MAEYGLTETGFLAKRFQNIISDLSSEINTNFGIDIDSNPDNKFKILVNILSLPLAQNWSSVQALQSMMDIDQASGIFLDYLTASKLIYRQEAVNATGDVIVTLKYEDEMTLPAGSSFYNNNNAEFNTTIVNTISTAELHRFKATYEIGYSGDITLIINGVTFTRNTTTEGSFNDAVDLLEADLVSSGYYIEKSSLNGYLSWTVRSEDTVIDTTPSFTLTLQSGFEIDRCEISKAINVEYVEEGDYSFLANSLTIAPPFSAIESFTNSLINGGRYRETDEELRERFKQSPALLGKATARAIKSAVLALEGVSDVSVGQNKTMQTDSEGRPPKSLEVVVKGGIDEDIAETLYETVGAGIELYGSTDTEIEDENGLPYKVYYSRVLNKYISTRITYTLYDEEEFPSNGVQLISDSVMSYINNLDAGTDVIQGRVSSNIFKNVTGIETVEVELFGSVDVNETPVYSSTPVKVSASEEATQLSGKIIILEG